jgi:dihydrofolate reductase
MINHIVIVDNQQGMADDHGIPWPPLDLAYFRQKSQGHLMVMGYRTYQEFNEPLPKRRNLVVVHPGTPPLRAGFEAIEDIDAWLTEHRQEEVWIIGGAGLFAQTLNRADFVYITRIDQKFACTKFYPQFESDFKRIKRDPDQQKHNLTFHTEVWQRKNEVQP